MKTIAILNLKGGTAKTVTAATMARCLSAEYSESVVLIDADQQGNLSQYFGITDTSQCGNTWRLLTEGAGYWPDFVTPISPTLDLIPSGMELARADLPNSGFKVTQIEELRTVLAEDNLDFLIIDLPPSLGTVVQAALLAADEVIIPIRLDTFSTAGMAKLAYQVDSMRSVNPRIRISGILGTQYQHTAYEREVHRLLLLESGLPVFQTLIRMSPPVPKSFDAHESILTFSPRCGATKDYRAFVEEYLEGSHG
nr:ParA family protein [uncultured Oscillibacter sp.]